MDQTRLTREPFPSYEAFQEMLSEIMDEMPQDFYEGLSGGIVLQVEAKYHKITQPGRPLLIMGEYQRSALGKQIKIYYGSFKKVYMNQLESVIAKRLREVVLHEFTHHLEGRAGLKTLEETDRERIGAYLKKTKNKT